MFVDQSEFQIVAIISIFGHSQMITAVSLLYICYAIDQKWPIASRNSGLWQKIIWIWESKPCVLTMGPNTRAMLWIPSCKSMESGMSILASIHRNRMVLLRESIRRLRKVSALCLLIQRCLRPISHKPSNTLCWSRIVCLNRRLIIRFHSNYGIKRTHRIAHFGHLAVPLSSRTPPKGTNSAHLACEENSLDYQKVRKRLSFCVPTIVKLYTAGMWLYWIKSRIKKSLRLRRFLLFHSSIASKALLKSHLHHQI